MYKVPRPHLASGYFVKVQYEATTDEDGRPDWLMHYTPCPQARAEATAFIRLPGAEAARPPPPRTDGEQEALVTSVTREPPVVTPTLPAAARIPHAVAPMA